jgi:hypothetical protein
MKSTNARNAPAHSAVPDNRVTRALRDYRALAGAVIRVADSGVVARSLVCGRTRCAE